MKQLRHKKFSEDREERYGKWIKNYVRIAPFILAVLEGIREGLKDSYK